MKIKNLHKLENQKKTKLENLPQNLYFMDHGKKGKKGLTQDLPKKELLSDRILIENKIYQLSEDSGQKFPQEYSENKILVTEKNYIENTL